MPSKIETFRYPIPIGMAGKVMRTMHNVLDNFQVIEADETDRTAMTIWREMTSNETLRTWMTVTARRVSAGEIEVELHAKNDAWFDPKGYLPTDLRRFRQAFQVAAKELVETSEISATNLFVCPSCKRELPQGAKFCPYDGTLVAHECSSCKSVNPVTAQFCYNCGTKL